MQRTLSTRREYYDDYWVRPEWEVARPLDALAPVFVANLTPRDHCLDVACGDGRRYGQWVQRHVHEYVGVDVSQKAVESARSLGLDARRIEDAARLPFPDNMFDVAICVEALEHFFAPHEAAIEIARVMRPGGRFIVTVPNAAFWRHRFDLAVHGRFNPYGDELSSEKPWRDPHIRFFVADSLRRMLLESGFSEVRVDGLNDRSALLDLPPRGVFGRFARRREPGPVLRRASVMRPGFFAVRLSAVAVK